MESCIGVHMVKLTVVVVNVRMPMVEIRVSPGVGEAVPTRVELK